MEGLKKLFLPVTATLGFIQKYFKSMLFLLLLFVLFAPANEQDLVPNNLQEIKLIGPIFDTTDVVEQIDEACENEKIKGVLLTVDSPGGTVPPSIEVMYAVKRLKAVKPVVVYAAGTLASGSYYASVYADEIIANPGSMVGSIGVIMHGANVEELMQKIGIKSQVIQAGKYKQVGTVDREWTAAEKRELDKVIQGTYKMFVHDVATARGLKEEQSHLYADAHIFTAAQAKEVGLVDTLGVSFDAKKRVEVLSKVTNPRWNKEDKFDKFMKRISAETATMVHIYFPTLSLR
ncbi:MAG: signal peptide peptidase SppA [Helicobacteraceae bacterium]|jgi:protease-4|nr:signal peptide peptidase SppA [Helicobacteraceae bacterium]